MKTHNAKRLLAGLAGIGVSALVLAGCASEAETTAPTTTDESSTETAVEGLDFLACAVSDEGSWNDKSFNEAVYDGLLQAQAELGVQIADAESNSGEAYGPNLQAMVDRGCDVIFGVGFLLVEDINIAAAANPDMKFVTVDGWSEGNDNLKPVGYKMEESSYLAGYVAAAYASLDSDSGVVGTYGGVQIDAVVDFMDGYYYGAMAYAADSGKDITVVGWDPAAGTGQFIGNFVPNSPESKAIAATLIEQGATVIFPVGGDQFGAVAEAIADANIQGAMIGVDKDIALTSPQYASLVLTSAEKRMTAATFDIIREMAIDGVFTGDYYMGTLANDGTDISPFYEFDSVIPQEVKDRVNELRQGIIDGTIDPRS